MPVSFSRLGHKLLLAFSVLVVGLTVALLLIVESRQRVSIVRQMQKRGVAIATHLAAVSTRSLLAYDFVTLEQDVEKVSADPDVLYGIVLDRDGRVAVYSGHDEEQGRILQDEMSLRAAKASETLIQHVPSQPGEMAHYDIAVPVFVSPQVGADKPEKWGTVRVGLSLQDMHAEIRRTRLQVLLLGLVGILCSTTSAAYLARRIAAPIRDLTEGTMAVARGELDHVIPVRTRDEIALLATNFNHMINEMSKHRDALEATNRELDAKVQELCVLSDYNDNIRASMTSGLMTFDLEGRFQTCNAAAERIMGLHEAEVRGQSSRDVLAPYKAFVHVIEASLQRGVSLHMPRLEWEQDTGQKVSLNVRTAMLHDHAGSTVGLLVIFEDLSPIQTLERRLRRADRLATLGYVAAGLAHEVKNPLTSVRAFVQLVRRKHEDREFIEQFDRVVLREVDRINDIVEDFLDITRLAPLHRVPIDILACLGRITETYSQQIQQQHIVLESHWPRGLPQLDADPEQLYRALGNIVLNALEAMPEGGRLSITCRAVPRSVEAMVSSSYRSALTEALVRQDYVAMDLEIMVRDTGIGIPAEQLDDLFTPFYSTKKRGTGLGLALTLKIIEEHAGSINVTSEVGVGTSVVVALPLSHVETRHAALIA
jgi:two-component system sensor histidine kinase AtoS